MVQLRLDDHIGSFRIGLNALSLAHRAESRLPRGLKQSVTKLSWRLTPNQTAEIPQPPRVFVLPSNKRDPQHSQPKKFLLPLRKEQLRSLWWMLQQERAEGKTHTFVEEEISEAALPALGWRAEGKAERPIMVRGGVIADQVGYGKTIISLALAAETKGDKAPDPEPEGRIDLKATLIVVPGHLSKQWPSEIKTFTGQLFNVVVIQNMKDLYATSIATFRKADIVVMASDIFESDSYWERFEYLAAQPEGWLGDKNGGRFFSERLNTAMETLLSVTECLKTRGAPAAHELMLQHHQQAVRSAESKTRELKAAEFGKRLKGAAYRDKYDSTQPPSKKAKGGVSRWDMDEDEDEDQESEPLLSKPTFHRVEGRTSISGTAVGKDFDMLDGPVVHMFR